MKLGESLTMIKALADSSRLRILQALLEKPQYVEELAARLNLAAPTVSFHLKKLEQARFVSKQKEQYYVMFQANREAFALTLQDLVSIEDGDQAVQEERILRYRQKVLRTFFRCGKLLRLPTQQKKRRIVLEEFTKLFEANRTYPESELNAKIAAMYEDYCTIRRELIERRIMAREGPTYWLLETDAFASLIPSMPLPQQEQKTMDRRTELKLAYKQNPPLPGVYQITNLVNGKRFVGSGPNVKGQLNRHQATLKMNVHRNRALQHDWNASSPNDFTFEVLEYLEPQNKPGYDYREDLAVLEELWLKKLQPYGEKGYNKPPKA
jgi:hypothetical protein